MTESESRTWSIYLESQIDTNTLPAGADPIADPMVLLLEALQELGADGPVTTGGASMVGARFCIEARDALEASSAAVALFRQAGKRSGLGRVDPHDIETELFEHMVARLDAPPEAGLPTPAKPDAARG